MSLALQRNPLPPAASPILCRPASAHSAPGSHCHDLYRRLAQVTPDQNAIDDGAVFLNAEIAACSTLEDGLPQDPAQLYEWVHAHAADV